MRICELVIEFNYFLKFARQSNAFDNFRVANSVICDRLIDQLALFSDNVDINARLNDHEQNTFIIFNLFCWSLQVYGHIALQLMTTKVCQYNWFKMKVFFFLFFLDHLLGQKLLVVLLASIVQYIMVVICICITIYLFFFFFFESMHMCYNLLIQQAFFFFNNLLIKVNKLLLQVIYH